MSRQNRKGKLEATQQTAKFFETLLRASSDGIVITDATQSIVVVNEAFCDFFGERWRNVAETSLFAWLERLDPDASHRWAEMERCVRLEGMCHGVEFRLTTEDRMRHFSVNASLMERVADEEAGVIISVWRDVAERARSQEALRKARDELEMRVEERAAELAKSNEELRVEIAERKRTEEALRESEERLRLLLESADDIVIMQDREGRYLYYSGAPRYGLEASDVVGRTPFDFHEPAVAARIMKQIDQVIDGGQSLTVENQIVWEEETIWFLDQVSPVRDDTGCIIGVTTISRNITERKRVEQALRASEAYTRSIIESSLDMIIASDVERRIVEFNRAAEETFGYCREEVIGEHVDILYADPQEGLAVHAATVKEGRCVREILDRRKSGEVFPAFLSASILWDVHGEIVGVMGVARDITEQKRAEAELETYARQQAALFQLSAGLAVTLDEADVCREVIRGLHDTLGYDHVGLFIVDETTGERVLRANAGWPDAPPDWRISPGHGLSECPLLDGQLRYTPDVTRDSRYVPGLDSGAEVDVPIWIGGEVVGVLVVESKEPDGFGEGDFAVLTAAANLASVALERAREHQAVKEAEARYRGLFNGVPVGLYRTTPAGQILDANPALVRMLGYPDRESLLAANAADIHMDPEDRRQWQALVEREGIISDFEARLRQCDGTIIWVEDDARVVRDQNGQVLRYEGALEDITERKQAEEELRLLSSAVEQSTEGIAMADLEGNLLYSNNAFASAHGYTGEEIAGKHLSIFHTPEQLPSVEEANRQIQETGEFSGEIWHVRRDGTVFPTLMRNSLLRDEAGNPIGMIGTLRDITERKRVEEALRRRNQELAMLNRAGQALVSTLDPDRVLVTVLEEVRRLLDVVAASVWLLDSASGELVCLHATGPENEIVRSWRLARGQGIAGWVAHRGESLVVPDAWADERYFKGVDQQTGLGLRSILTVPLRVREDVIGVLQVVDTMADRFGTTDLGLLEPLAATAAIAIENARLYEQARQDAETKSVLLREVNHRVKNNLSAIIGLLYAERRHADVEDEAVYKSITENLVNRVQGLSTVHSLLSASEWAPLSLSELTAQVIRSSLRMLPRDKQVSVDVTPSPVLVTSDQAHNLTLVINELATNTVRHTLRERDAVRITVCIAVDDDGGDNAARAVLFEFRDDGPGYPADVLRLERHNVGFDLVQNIVRKSLLGELSLYNDPGAVAAIRFAVRVDDD